MQNGFDITLEGGSGQSLYRQLSDGIAHAILHGKLRPNDRLPTEEELAERLHVHRLTVSRGYDLLRDQGLVVRQRGRGTFVSPGVRAMSAFKDRPLSMAAFIYSSDESRSVNTIDHFIRIEFLNGYSARLRKAGVTCEVICMADLHAPQWSSELTRLDGTVIWTWRSGEPRCAWDLVDHGVRCVIPFWPSSMPRVPTIGYDRRHGPYLAVKHLAERGCRKIGFMGRGPNADIHPKFDGYLQGLRESGLEMRAIDVLDFGNAPLPGVIYGTLVTRIDQGGLPDAFVCETDHAALEALHALRDKGIRVPEDVALVGYNNTTEAEKCCPSLTSIRPAFDAMGERAAEMLLNWPEEGVPDDVILQPQLIVRESTRRGGAPVPQGALGGNGDGKV